MKVEAELIVRGPITLLGAGATPPDLGAAVDDEDRLWIDGTRVGTVARAGDLLCAWPWDVTHEYTDTLKPHQIVRTSKVNCVLDLPAGDRLTAAERTEVLIAIDHLRSHTIDGGLHAEQLESARPKIAR